MTDDLGRIWWWILACPYGCSFRVESTTTAPPVDLAAMRCAYHDLPLQNFKPVDVPS